MMLLWVFADAVLQVEEERDREGGEGVGSGLAGLHMEGAIVGKLDITHPWRGSISRVIQAWDQSIWKTEE